MKKTLRRILGILVMIAGILGLVLSIAGLVGVWAAKPAVAQGIENTITTLSTSIDTSKQIMLVTGEALGATVNSVNALQTMLEATASSVQDTQPLLNQITSLMGEKLPGTIQSASDSLVAAQSAAETLDSAMRSFDALKGVLAAIPFIGPSIPTGGQPYDPKISLADSLGSVATQLESLPKTFEDMSKNLDTADNNLVTIKSSLSTMATNVSTISSSIDQYKNMVAQSQSSMENLQGILTNIQANLNQILTAAVWALTLFFLWLLAAQVVILSQGWELYQGTADRMESTT
jgi:peptidoglycan hydrolase CwlO-like protein